MGEKDIVEILVEKGKEHGAHSESIYKSDSFFSNSYHDAGDWLQEIISESESAEYGRESGSAEHVSNIIAFCAERGQGKTRAMLSMAEALRYLGRSPDGKVSESGTFWNEEVQKYRFEILDNIDPSRMGPRDAIVKMVLSRLFINFKDAYKAHLDGESALTYSKFNRNAEEDSLRERILRYFRKCWRSLEILHNEGIGEMLTEGELERLEERGDSSNLRDDIFTLIGLFLKYKYPDSKARLVLQIDDADLDLERIYNILEDLHKYLDLPNTVILLAANMTQLESVVEKYFIDKYEVSLRFKDSMVTVERCHEIAERYLEKILPSSRRVYLPDINTAILERYSLLRIRYMDGDTNLLTDDYSESKGGSWDLQDQLLYLLHRKTGLVFMKSSNSCHELLPSSMRELMHFLMYFTSMEDVKIGYNDLLDAFSRNPSDSFAEDLSLWKHNLKRFEHYLIDLWSASNLTDERRRLLRGLARQPRDGMHRYLYETYNMTEDAKGEGEKRFPKMSSEKYADIMVAMDNVTLSSYGTSDSRFSYAIRAYYGIQLHQIVLNHIESLNADSPRNPDKIEPDDFLEFIGAAILHMELNEGETKNLLYRDIPLCDERLKARKSKMGAKEKKVLVHFIKGKISENNQEKGGDFGFIKMGTPDDSQEKGKDFYLDDLDKHPEIQAIFSVQLPWISLINQLFTDCDSADNYIQYAPTNEGNCNLRQDTYQAFTIILNPEVQYALYQVTEKISSRDPESWTDIKNWYESRYLKGILEDALVQNNLSDSLKDPLSFVMESDTADIFKPFFSRGVDDVNQVVEQRQKDAEELHQKREDIEKGNGPSAQADGPQED